MADNEIFCTVKLDEDDWKAIERAIMSIEKRLERIEAILDARGLDWDHPRVEDDHFAGANKMVAEEPPKKWRILEPGEVVCSIDWVNAKSNLPHGLGWKLQTFSTGQTVSKHDECVFARPVAEEPAKEAKAEYPVVPMPDPGEGYRLLSKNPPEELTPEIDDWWEYDEQRWRGVFPLDLTAQHPRIWYRRKIEVAKQPEPAWEPKVGEWVRVTRPSDWEGCRDPDWLPIMHEYHDKVMQVSSYENRLGAWCAKCDGVDWFFHRDWLSPAEPPATEKPAEPEYREPVLPADAGKYCQFSDDGIEWRTGWLNGWGQRSHQWVSHSGGHWRHCRIKKDA